MENTFYEHGLRFGCTRCSRCCRIEPGFVFLSYEDLERLIAHFRISPAAFLETYCRRVDLGIATRLSLREKENYDCILWSVDGCSAYEARPLQCRSYPFWEPHLESEHAWRELKSECPGVDRGELHTAEEIEDWILKRRNERFIDLEKDDLKWLTGQDGRTPEKGEGPW